jgi:hypothetical protein
VTPAEELNSLRERWNAMAERNAKLLRDQEITVEFGLGVVASSVQEAEVIVHEYDALCARLVAARSAVTTSATNGKIPDDNV